MTGSDEDTTQGSSENQQGVANQMVRATTHALDFGASKVFEGLKRFADLEASAGITLVIAAVLALYVSNSAYTDIYHEIFSYKLTIKFGPYDFGKSLLHWINDGLMTIFFFLIGLEIKREFLEGELNSIEKLVLPMFAAAGGMIVPALFFIAINAGEYRVLEGWAIPMATDIAFAMGALALLGKRIPIALSVFLLSVAIFDDLGAIVVIAMYYANDISLTAIVSAAAILAMLVLMNLVGVRRLSVFIGLGFLLWLAVLESGVHATIAGVLLAFTIPIGEQDGHSPLKHLEDRLHPWSAYLILPLFAFANAGVSFKGITVNSLSEGMTLGIIAGLVIGKPLGILVASRISLIFPGVKLPENVSWTMLFGASCLAGIGFTMSLFIGTLAYETNEFDAQIRLGVISGSILSGVIGLIVMTFATIKTRTDEN